MKLINNSVIINIKCSLFALSLLSNKKTYRIKYILNIVEKNKIKEQTIIINH